jgi:hypothetical protein
MIRTKQPSGQPCLFQVSNLLYPAIADAKAAIPDLFVQECVVVFVGTVSRPGQLSDRIDRQGELLCFRGYPGETGPNHSFAVRHTQRIGDLNRRESRFPDRSNAPPVRFLTVVPSPRFLERNACPFSCTVQMKCFDRSGQSFEASHGSQSRNTHLDSISVALRRVRFQRRRHVTLSLSSKSSFPLEVSVCPKLNTG